MLTVAVMQPYFFPYGGYFSLLANVDEFVIFDCVQFPRRGRVHRTEVPGPAGRSQWLTLPIEPSPRETLIRDVAFAQDARSELDKRLAAFDWVRSGAGEGAEAIRTYLDASLGRFDDFLESGLQVAVQLLELNVRLTRSSTLGIDAAIRGQDRVLEVLRRLGATHYVNASGGRSLYDASRFNQARIRLGFMPVYDGPYFHMLHALMNHKLDAIRRDVVSRPAEFLA